MSILSLQPEEPEFAGYFPEIDSNRTGLQIDEVTIHEYWARVCSDQTTTLSSIAAQTAAEADMTAAHTQALAIELPLKSFDAIMIDGNESFGEALANRARSIQQEVPLTASRAKASKHHAEIAADDPSIGIVAPTRRLRQLAQCVVEASETDIASLAPTDQVKLIQELATVVVEATWAVEGRGEATTTVRQGLIQQAVHLASMADSRPNLVIVDDTTVDTVETEPVLFEWDTDPYPEINDETVITVTGFQRDIGRIMHHYDTSVNCGCESCQYTV